MTAEEALSKIENKTSITTIYTRAEMIFFANYFAEIHHYAKLKELEEKDFVCGIVRQRCDVQCSECKND